MTSGAAIRIDAADSTLPRRITDLAGDGGGGGALRNLANNNIWSGAIAIAASGARINSDAGLLTLSGAITENGTSLVLTFGGAGDITVSNTITAGLNDLAVTKDGAGTLTFSGGGANTYDQVTTVNGGTLVLNKTAGVNAIAGALTIGDGTGTDTVQLLAANQIVNTSAVTINSSGVFDLNGNAETIGSLTGSTGASVTLGAATLTLGDANSTAYAGTISGAGGLTKLGAGTLTLSGANSYDGTTLISAGVLNIQNNTALGSTTGGTTVTGGAALQLQGGITVGNEALSLNGTGVGATGALRNISGDNVWQGTTTLLSATRINSDAGSLTFNTAANSITGTNQNLTLGGAGNGTVAGTITTGSGTLTKDGAGTWTLSGANTYTGTTTVSAGVLNIQNNTALGTTAAGTTVANGATLQLQGGITVGAEALTISGSGPASQNGALVNVSGTNNYGGLLTLGAAATISSDLGVLNLTNTGTITGATFGLTLTGSGDGTIASAIGTTSGTLTKSGTGTWTLSGTNTYTGTTTVNAGTLSLDYSTNDTSKLANGAALILGGGTLNLSGGTHTEVVASTTLNPGASSVTRTSGAGVLRMNAITRNAGSTVNFGAGSIADTDTSNTNGILGGYATVGAVTGAADWAMSATSAADTAITAFTSYTTFVTSGGSATTNYLLSGSAALTATESVNSLKIDTTAASQSLDIGATRTLTITSGGLMFVGANDYQINNGTLKSNTPTNSDLIVQQWGAGSLTVNSVIANGNGTSTLTKAGSGTLVLGAANTYTGTTYVNAGTLLVNNTGLTSGTGTGAVIVNGSGTVLGGTGRITGAVTVNSNAIILGGTGTAASGALTLNGNLTLSTGSVIELALGNSYTHSTLARTGSGTWTFGANQLFTFLDLGVPGADPGYYDNIITGVLNPGDLSGWTITNAGWAGTFSWDGTNIDLMLTMSSVPEPSTWVAGILTVGFLVWSQRRRLSRRLRRSV